MHKHPNSVPSARLGILMHRAYTQCRRLARIIKISLREVWARRRLRRRLAQLEPDLALPYPELRCSTTRTKFRYDCRVERAAGRYRVTFLGDRIRFVVRFDRVPAALYWLSRCPPAIESIVLNLSDGDAPSLAPFAASVNKPNIVPLPDKDFVTTRGFEDLRAFVAANDVEWHRRTDRVQWRGATNGSGSKDYSAPNAQWDKNIIPRIRMALILRGVKGTDVAFSHSYDRKLAARLRRDGLLKDRIPQTDWINDKLALDIDGTTNTWSNFLARLHLGCCVLKVDSQEGYIQWYYDRIRPWEHFIPVKADMTDLVEKIEWARSRDGEARRIAENGRAFARSMTLESETAYGVAAICAASGILRN
jgi:hypothetical protein